MYCGYCHTPMNPPNPCKPPFSVKMICPWCKAIVQVIVTELRGSDKRKDELDEHKYPQGSRVTYGPPPKFEQIVIK